MTTLFTTDKIACPDGCCVVTHDPLVGGWRGVYVRPMFEVLRFSESWTDSATWTAADGAVDFHLRIEAIDGASPFLSDPSERIAK